MLTSISPLGERARGNRWSLTVTWLVLGTLLGGATLGAVLGILGQSLPITVDEGWRLAVLALAGAAAAVWDLKIRRFPVHRQVNEDWLSAFRPWVYGWGYGLQLGAAVITAINTALVPMFMLAALLTRDPMSGLLVGAAFGAVRGLTVTLNRRVRNAADLRRLHHRLDTLAHRARRLGALAAALLAAVSAIALVA
jgi:MFS family permease